MKIVLSIDAYSGVDGSSISSTRCSQIVKVYEMLEDLGDTVVSYRDIQEEADKRKLFGKTKAASAIRTFFPLLKKINFIEYDGLFVANRCFTGLGKMFTLACRALAGVTDETPHKDEIISKLNSIKCNAQREGLINMYKNPDCKSHNMWIALKLLKEFRILHWNEFLYALHCIEEERSISDAIEDIKLDKKNIDLIEFVNKKNNPLPNTCYSYLRSFLEEAGLITNISPLESRLLPEAELFYSQIEL